MAWVTFPTLIDGQILTGAHMAIIQGNFAETAVAKATAAGQMFVATAANALAARVPSGLGVTGGGTETTTSTSYGNLPAGTVGPTLSNIVHGAQCVVAVGARIQNNTSTAEGYAGFAMSGTNNVAATDNSALFYQAFAANAAHRGTASLMVTGLTPGTTTFTMQYRVSAGTGTFTVRQLAVIPF